MTVRQILIALLFGIVTAAVIVVLAVLDALPLGVFFLVLIIGGTLSAIVAGGPRRSQDQEIEEARLIPDSDSAPSTSHWPHA